jgi:hypothetical protein
MGCSNKTKYFLAFGLALALLPDVKAQSLDQAQSSQLRMFSFGIRNENPSADEARKLALGETTLDSYIDSWLESDAHQKKVFQFFSDLFGTPDFSSEAGFQLEVDKDGIYYSEMRGSCTTGSSQSVTAWWSKNQIKLCTDILSEQIEIGTPNTEEYVHCSGYYDGITREGCGCGPDRLFCFPAELSKPLAMSLLHQIANRGLHIYNKGGSWTDFLAGDRLYANRLIYYYYLWQPIMGRSQELSAEDLQTLKSLPINQLKEVPWPRTGPIRSPIVTAPYFMIHYNNFRSRISALSRIFLCSDIGPHLNTDGIQTLVNEDLSDFDKVHGTKSGCSSCHYALDNLGSGILGWSDLGGFEPGIFKEGANEISQAGHFFGGSGEGPRELMRSFATRGPGFSQCMAKRVWESIAGSDFSSLSDGDQSQLSDLVAKGPRGLIQGIIRSEQLRNLP